MSRLRIIPIVEGFGEVQAARTLLQRVWVELLGGEFVDVLPPIRGKLDRLVSDKFDDLCKYVELAVGKLKAVGDDGCLGLVLVLVDAEDAASCQLGPSLLERAKACRPDVDLTCVVATPCFETWFVAGAESLTEHLDLVGDVPLPSAPEQARLGKAWIKQRIRRPKYSETVDMPRLTAAMDLKLCRERPPSFDKLCRELEARLVTINTKDY